MNSRTIDSDDEQGDFGGEAIPSYNVHHLSATLRRDAWTLQAYVDNLWDEYYITGTRESCRFLADERSGPGRNIEGATLRRYGQLVGTPRAFGFRVNYEF